MYCTKYNIKHTSKILDYSKEKYLVYFITNKSINKSITKKNDWYLFQSSLLFMSYSLFLVLF